MYVGKTLFAGCGWPPAAPPAAGAGAEGVLGAHALRSGMPTAVASAPARKFRRLTLRCSRLSITSWKPPPREELTYSALEADYSCAPDRRSAVWLRGCA